MKEFWDTRYSEEDFAYGTTPNKFFQENLDKYQSAGKLLLPAEGEGRNAVFAAKNGFRVFAFDISSEGKKKAERLADKEKVDIHYEVGEFPELSLAQNFYDGAALIFAHFPTHLLKEYHRRTADLIKPGGLLILEGFSKNHLELRLKDPSSGGPNNVEMLFNVDSIRSDFHDFEPILLEEEEIHLLEGKFHNGPARVIRFIGRKNYEVGFNRTR